MFKITVSQSERHLFSCGWIEGFDYPFHANGDSGGVATCLLNFSDIYAPENVSVKKMAPIEISYECGDLSFGRFELLANQPFQIKQGESKWFSASFLVYQEIDSLQMWILKTWSEGCSDISWRNFPSARQKLSWLSACSSWHGSILHSDAINPPDHVILDISGLDSQESFFCALGEAALGRRGYMGKDLDGFYECLGLLTSTKSSQILFHFTGVKSADDFSIMTGGANFFEKMKRIIDTHGCSVLLLDI